MTLKEVLQGILLTNAENPRRGSSSSLADVFTMKKQLSLDIK
jgi:hypothetical protein